MPITYLNQGFIDRTARDPDEVEELINDKMDTTDMDDADAAVEHTLDKLKGYREAYLKRAKLKSESEEIQGKLAGARKFFEISKTPAYKKLERRRQTINESEKSMKEAIESVEALENLFADHAETLSSIEVDVESLAKLFPSVDVSDLGEIVSLSETVEQKLESLREKLEKSAEMEKIAKDKKKLSGQIKDLFAKENIKFTQSLWDEKDKQVRSLEAQERQNETQLKACENNLKEFNAQLKVLKTEVEELDDARNKAMRAFNDGLVNVEVQFTPENVETWLVEVLTNEAKAAWDQFTPNKMKLKNRFRKPSADDINTMFERMYKNGVTPATLCDELVRCLKNGTIPIKGDFEYLKWLFGDNSQVIKDHLLLRLQEHIPTGQLGLYYQGKNIATEGLSYTERCGALLEIIVEKGVEPIIIDQPEDNLGSSYITKTLIPTILRKKHERQFILVSHNPNTVVLADSDLVIAFDRVPKTDEIDLKSGAIESGEMKQLICEIIEGGTEAFKTRMERYQFSEH